MAEKVDPLWHHRHDVFNLVLVPVVVLYNILYLSNTSNQIYSHLQYIVFFAYLILDILFVLAVPRCVASPRTIVIHHIIVILGWSLMLVDSTFYSWISLGMLVEINTWFHVARRNWRSSLVIQILFFVSWFLLRNVLYPVVLILFTSVYIQYCTEHNSIINSGLICWILIVLLNYLNAQWTYDLTKKTKWNGWKIVFDEKNDKGL